MSKSPHFCLLFCCLIRSDICVKCLVNCHREFTCLENIVSSCLRLTIPWVWKSLHCLHLMEMCGIMYLVGKQKLWYNVANICCHCPLVVLDSCFYQFVEIYKVTTSSTIPKLPREEDSHSSKWLVLFFVVSFASGAAAGAVIYLKKFFHKNERDTGKFQQLSQMQARDFLDDDDEESSGPPVVHNDDDAHR
ncbi:hypothetical protein MKW94_022644 [Papaver nudicaule]|uniref:Uncharacterized protein n=1 Tax=Papaver nudicaule TaxID=74823 RepID=A0AA41RYQ0_PAPNU|nr:hypothetical protein [Papaver nudicaule]